MGLEKAAFNFMVNVAGKLAKTLLCSKPISKPINFKELKYAPLLEKVSRLDFSLPVYFG
ncbi:hypothetical protein IJ670_03035 [bacterium]|nr:hypothetical protein [bacterium]